MRAAVLLAVAAPAAAAAVLAIVPRRIVAVAGAAAGVAGSAWLTAAALRSGGVAWEGFEADPWRAGLALGVWAIGLAWAVSPAPVDRSGAVVLAAFAAGAAHPLAAHVVTAAAFMVALGVGALAVATMRGAGGRSAGLVAASDVLAVAGLVLAAERGARVPPELDGTAAVLVGIAAVIKLTQIGAPRVLAGAGAPSGGVEAIVLGPVRVHGLGLAAWVVVSDPSVAVWLGGSSAVIAFAAARSAARTRSWRAGLAASAALVGVGLGTGTSAAVGAAGLLAAGAAIATILVLSGERSWAGSSIGAAPLGATLAGAAWIATEAVTRGVVDRPFLIVALPAVAAFALLAQAAASLHPATQRARGARAVLVGLALGGAAVLAFLPGSIAEAIAPRIATSIGGVAPLAAASPAVADRVGLAFAVAAVAALAATARWELPRARAAPAPAEVPSGRAMLVVGWAAFFAALGGVLLLLARGAERGFL